MYLPQAIVSVIGVLNRTPMTETIACGICHADAESDI